MKSLPIHSIPVIEKLSTQTAKMLGLKEWGIGVDLLVYRSNNDGIGWHSDNSQCEEIIFTIILESPMLDGIT